MKNKIYLIAIFLFISISSFSQSANGCSCLATIDSSFSVAEFTNGVPPDYRNDDGSTAAITIPFNFCFFGTLEPYFYINNNGSISFSAPYFNYVPVGMPFYPNDMIAPFWSGVDTRNPASGLVYYKITSTYIIVQWKEVGYYNMQTDKVNTFQLIISDGSGTILPVGKNVAFCYGDMQWTTGDSSGGTNGFGGQGAIAGINQGNGVGGFQIGQFSQALHAEVFIDHYGHSG